MGTTFVAALWLLGLAAVASAHRPFRQRGIKYSCNGQQCSSQGNECIRQPRGICQYARRRHCPKEICVPFYASQMCTHGACPSDGTCRLDGYNKPVCGGGRCVSRTGHGCLQGEVCVRKHAGGHTCVKVDNMHAGRFDGRNAKGVFVPCTSKEDCRGWCAPIEWTCCSAQSGFRHRTITRHGSQCDTRIGACTVERYEFGKLRWALVQRKSEVNKRKCHKICPCCRGGGRRAAVWAPNWGSESDY